MSDIFYRLYGNNVSFVLFIRFIIMEMISLIILMMAVKNIAVKLNVPHINYAYLIFSAVLSMGTYNIVKNNWVSNILLMLFSLFVLCLTDCIVYSMTKKKAVYMLLNIAIILIVFLLDRNIQPAVFGYTALIFIPQIVLVLLIKGMYKLRNIWQKLILIIYFVALYLVNFQILCI
jgi:hypothetical protein